MSTWKPPWCSCKLDGTCADVLVEQTQSFSTPKEIFDALLGYCRVPDALQQNIGRISHCLSEPLSDLQKFVIVIGLCQRDLLCACPAGFGQLAAALVSMLAVTVRERRVANEPRKGLCPDALVLCATKAACSEAVELAEELTEGTDLQCLRVSARGQGSGGLMLVATPQELLESKDHVDLKDCFGLILHGASTMLDMGLHSDIRKVLRQGLPKADQRHTMIFGCASDRLHDLKGELLFIPVSSSVSGPLTIEAKECGRRIQHSWEVVRWEEKLEKLVSVVKDFLRRSRWKQQVVVFAHSVMHVRAIEAYVDGDSWLEGVHGSDSDAQVAAKHQEKWSSFSKAEKLVVACTEKGAKRKDISFAMCIVNFDIPRDVEKLIKRFGQGNSRLGPSTEIVTFVSQENFAEDRAESTHEVLDELARGFESPVPPEILSLASASSTWTPAREEPTWPQMTTQPWDSAPSQASSWRRDDWYEDSSWQDNSWKDDANGKWYADTNKGDTWQNQPQWTQERADCNSWQDSGQSWNRPDPWPAWQ